MSDVPQFHLAWFFLADVSLFTVYGGISDNELQSETIYLWKSKVPLTMVRKMVTCMTLCLLCHLVWDGRWKFIPRIHVITQMGTQRVRTYRGNRVNA